MDGSYKHDRDRHKHQSAVLAVFAETCLVRDTTNANDEGRESWLQFSLQCNNLDCQRKHV